MNRVAIYTRVSTASQDDNAQLQQLVAYCNRLGVKPFRLYREKVSGIKGADQRPELGALLSDARKRHFNKVLVWSVDRLARSIPHLVTTLQELRECKVDIVSLHQGIDTSTPMGSAMWQLLGIFSEFEYNIRKERQALGIAKAKANGVRFGRKPMNWLIKQKVLKLRAKGMGMNRIARTLGVGTGAVVRVLNEPSLGSGEKLSMRPRTGDLPLKIENGAVSLSGSQPTSVPFEG